jgi:hypothetical protein
MALVRTTGTLDAKEIFGAAQRFTVAANCLYEKGLLPNCFLPHAVLLMFSTELMLKCLKVIEAGDHLITHELRSLVDDLSQPSRDKLIVYTKQYYDRHWGPQMRAAIAATMPQVQMPQFDLDRMLDEATQIVQRTRYFYDYGRNSATQPGGFDCHCLGNAAQKVILELRPTIA